MARKSSFVTAVQKSRSHVRLEGHYCNIGLRVRTNISTNTNTRTSNIKQLISTIVSNMPYKNHITCEIGAKPRQCTKKKNTLHSYKLHRGQGTRQEVSLKSEHIANAVLIERSAARSSPIFIVPAVAIPTLV